MARKVKGAIFFLLALALVAGGVYFTMTWMQAPPRFQGPSADLKAELWKFRNSTDDSEHMKLAVDLKVRHSIRAALGTRSDLTSEELLAESEAIQLEAQIDDQVSLFESKLTRDDIDWITKDNSESVIRAAGEFRSQTAECTEQEYRSIRSQIDLPELQSRATCVMTLNQAYEQPFLKGYRARRLELLRRDSRFSESRKAGEAFYDFFEQHADPTQSLLSAQDLQLVHECETILRKSGLDESTLKPYLKRLAGIGPRCLLKLNQQFKEYLNRDITVARGRYLLGKLRQYVQMVGKEDVTLQDLPLDHGDPMYGSIQDAWYHDFQLLRDGSRFKLLSQGPDSKDPKSQFMIQSEDAPE